MNAKQLLAQIEQAIAESETEQAIDAFNAWTENRDLEERHAGVVLAGQWEKFSDEKRAGILSPEEADRQLNKIHYDLLRLAKGLAEQEKMPVSPFIAFVKRYAALISAALWTLAAVQFFFTWFTKAGAVDIKVEMRSRGVAFIARENADFFSGQDIAATQLQNYRSIDIPADTLAMDKDLDERWDAFLPVNGALQLAPDADASFMMQKARISSLSCPANAFIAFEQPENNTINVRLARAAGAAANFYLYDTLLFQSASNRIAGLNAELNEGEPFLGKVVYKSGAPNMSVATDELFNILIQSDALENMTGRPIRVDSLRWETVERTASGPQQKSAILEGRADILSTGQSIRLESGQILRLLPDARFYLQELSIAPDGIRSVFAGSVKKVNYGVTPEQFTAFMPSRLEKNWKTAPSKVLALPVFVLIVSLLLLYIKRHYTISYEKQRN